jgi:serine phosphatase RsbU (regulator of sigma subunit)
VGDFYDLFPTGGRDWCAVMGDVCGKGVEAAKVTAQARYTVRAEAVHQTRPAKILRRLQEALVDQQISDRFLSAVLVIFQHSADGLNARLSNAGHPPALIRRADGSVEAVDCPGSILSPMIQSQDIRLGEVRLRLSPGDALLLYTDGITEARNGPGQPLFGEDRLAATLAETAGMEADSTLEHLRQAMVNHAKGSANDDTALMLIRVLPVG